MEYNERKREVLSLIAGAVTISAPEVAEQLGITPAAAEMALLRYHRQGKLAREWRPEGVYRYSVSERGQEWLDTADEEAET